MNAARDNFSNFAIMIPSNPIARFMRANNQNVLRRYVIPAAICLTVGACFDSSHPNRLRNEYLYINGSFQGSFGSFPEGSERSKWTCVDRETKKEFSCTMVRGGWETFQYIYRVRS